MPMNLFNNNNSSNINKETTDFSLSTTSNFNNNIPNKSFTDPKPIASLQSDHIHKSKLPQQQQLPSHPLVQTNQENVNPNVSTTQNNNSHSHSPQQQPKIESHVVPANSVQTTVPANTKNPSTKPTKKKWKEQYNIFIRAAKALQKNKEYLQALRKYIAAKKLSRKEQPKLIEKIEEVQVLCEKKGLHLDEEAFDQIGETRWFLNIVTDCYHMEKDKKDDIEDSDDEDDDEEEFEYILPAEIYDKLYDYQKDCLVWFWKVFQSPNGGILGDDMGLGNYVFIPLCQHHSHLII